MADPMAAVMDLVRRYEDLLVAVVILAGGVLVGYAIGWVSRRVLRALGVDEAVEGTAFERTAQGLNTSTVDLLSALVAWFIYIVAVLAALRMAGFRGTDVALVLATQYLPQLLVAALAVIVGIVVGDKTELLLTERLRSVKLPPAAIVPTLVRYTVIFLAALVALAHLGVKTAALLILLGGYLFAVVVLGAVALRDLLASGAAGTYLLLNQPYSIGDEIVVGDRQGIVQEVDVFVTHIENDDRAYVVPNRVVLQDGVARVMD
jgi:small-conductance mechanosensitive channel